MKVIRKERGKEIERVRDRKKKKIEKDNNKPWILELYPSQPSLRV